MTFAATISSPDPSPSPPLRHWVDVAVDDLERVTRQASPALARRMEAALGRASGMNGATTLREALLRPASTPFVRLVDAVASDLGLAGDERTRLLGRATVLLYLYVRVQDDIVDEPERVDRASLYAAEAFLAEHLALFGAAVPAAIAMSWRARIMRRFAEVAADEVDERAALAHNPDDLAWMGEKFLPMAVPLAGLAIAAGREHIIDELMLFVCELGTALQLMNDVFNVAEDAASARTTPVLRWLAQAGVDTQGPSLRAVLLSHPACVRALSEARSFAEAAEQRALAAKLPSTAQLAQHVSGMVDQAPQRLLKLMLGLSV